ncbi:uncharacterized protein CLUP02_16459 [Colletotrichum lupini]|uniref:Uncharacterized protein n=1 Tax=Colletotrichum lupini TaxID=145971 RepID=A0A9Q8T862_9PEZI|nr:uncharacterized protein CLUP02_16459 [Colletotrichum lupini]UQC90927.1 hypothetical protein CLUP02_16459 [Colletotrichum lupini]
MEPPLQMLSSTGNLAFSVSAWGSVPSNLCNAIHIESPWLPEAQHHYLQFMPWIPGFLMEMVGTLSGRVVGCLDPSADSRSPRVSDRKEQRRRNTGDLKAGALHWSFPNRGRARAQLAPHSKQASCTPSLWPVAGLSLACLLGVHRAVAVNKITSTRKQKSTTSSPT